MKDMQPFKIHISAVHNIERVWLRHDGIENFDVSHLSVGNLNESRDRTAEIKQGVHFYGALMRSKSSPREHGQTEIDGGGVQGINGVVEVETKRLADIHRASNVNECLGEIGKDAPVVSFIGVGQS